MEQEVQDAEPEIDDDPPLPTKTDIQIILDKSMQVNLRTLGFTLRNLVYNFTITAPLGETCGIKNINSIIDIGNGFNELNKVLIYNNIRPMDINKFILYNIVNGHVVSENYSDPEFNFSNFVFNIKRNLTTLLTTSSYIPNDELTHIIDVLIDTIIATGQLDVSEIVSSSTKNKYTYNGSYILYSILNFMICTKDDYLKIWQLCIEQTLQEAASDYEDDTYSWDNDARTKKCAPNFIDRLFIQFAKTLSIHADYIRPTSNNQRVLDDLIDTYLETDDEPLLTKFYEYVKRLHDSRTIYLELPDKLNALKDMVFYFWFSKTFKGGKRKKKVKRRKTYNKRVKRRKTANKRFKLKFKK